MSAPADGLLQVAAVLVLREGWTWQGGSSVLPGCGQRAGDNSSSSSSSSLDLLALHSHCRAAGLAGFKLPRYVAAQHTPLPTNASGKVVKPLVRQHLAEAQRAEAGATAGAALRSRL